MSNEPDFETYLISKKIDSEAFAKAEPEVWNSWKMEFGQLHPNSFTVQKLNMINPIRRKYPIQEAVDPLNPATTPPTEPSKPASAPAVAAAKPGRPVIKPRPKMG